MLPVPSSFPSNSRKCLSISHPRPLTNCQNLSNRSLKQFNRKSPNQSNMDKGFLNMDKSLFSMVKNLFNTICLNQSNKFNKKCHLLLYPISIITHSLIYNPNLISSKSIIKCHMLNSSLKNYKKSPSLNSLLNP